MALPSLTLVHRDKLSESRDVWDKLLRGMDYITANSNVITSHLAQSPKKLIDGGVEYSVPLWRPLLLDEDMIGGANLKPGQYLGTLTYQIFDPTAEIIMHEQGGKAGGRHQVRRYHL